MKNLLLLSLIITIQLTTGCKKNENEDAVAIDSGTPGNTLRTCIVGQVKDENGYPLNAVSVSASNSTVQTNYDGIFMLKDVSVNPARCVLTLDKPGYFKRIHAFIPSAGINYIRVTMVKDDVAESISSTSGATVTLSDFSSVKFLPNSFVTTAGVDYNGMVNISIKHLSPDDNEFASSIPGGDLAAKDANGNDVVLYSYGMIGVILKGSSGEVLQLAAGTTATIKTPIAASQLATAPATLPLWYFDESTNLWKEEGMANKIGNMYVATVSHFSWWNCDVPGARATVTGKVIDCRGTVISNAVVTFDGQYTLVSNQNGQYTSWVPAGMPHTSQVLLTNNPGFSNSQLENIPPLSPGQVYTVPDLVTACPARVSGIFTNCAGSGDPAIIFINDGTHSFFSFTPDGVFDVNVMPNAQASILALGSQGNFTDLITTPPQGQTSSLGTRVLCDSTPNSVSKGENWFILNGGGFNNKLFAIDTTETVHTWGTYSTYCKATGHDKQTGIGTVLAVYTGGNPIGSYPYNGNMAAGYVGLDIDGNNSGTFDFFTCNNNGLPGFGTIDIVRYDTIGGRVIAQFAGTIPKTNTNTLINVVGQVNVVRRQ